MHWLNPVAWLGALLVALPIAIHLFSRQPAKTVAFPSLRFLDVTRVLPTRRTSLTDLLLLALRVLALLVAAAALAQPLWPRTRSANGAIARAVIVESSGGAFGDSARAAQPADSLVASASQGLRLDTRDAHRAVAGALAWLRTQSGQRELAIVTSSAGPSLDSVDIAGIPSDVRIAVTRGIATAERAPSRIVLLDARNGESIIAAARSAGAALARDRVSAGESALVVVSTADGDSLAAWRNALTPLQRAWMGDMSLTLANDSTVASVAASTEVADTTLTAPWSVLKRNAVGAPVVAAAAHGTQLVLLVRANVGARDLLAASLLLGASRGLEASLDATLTAPDSATLARWIAARDPRTTLGTSDNASDYRTGLSDARYLWLAVLLLLGIETGVRRRMATA